MMTGLMPSRVRNIAVAAPPGPPPTIRTSVFIVGTSLLLGIRFPFEFSPVELPSASQTEQLLHRGLRIQSERQVYRVHHRGPNHSSVLWIGEFVSQIGARSGWKREPMGTEYRSSVS